MLVVVCEEPFDYDAIACGVASTGCRSTDLSLESAKTDLKLTGAG